MNSNSFYHIRARTNNKDWYGANKDSIWSVFENCLFSLNHQFGAEIYSFVLMNNHYHMLTRFPQGNMSEGMGYFQRTSSIEIGLVTNRINRVYGSRYGKTEINSLHYFLHAYKYLYRNPVKSGLCRYVEDYKFSTLQLLLGKRKIAVPLQEDTILFNGDWLENLRWLNTDYNAKDYIDIRSAMKKSEFKFRMDNSLRGPHRLETELC